MRLSKRLLLARAIADAPTQNRAIAEMRFDALPLLTC
jgi:hypothetical protein